MTREFPVFVPWREEHLAAVIAVPEGTPRGLVVLSTGLGAPRSHRYQVWAKASDELARSGVASIRWEYRGMHDSSGSLIQISTAEVPMEQNRTVAEFAQRALGVSKVVGVGNCYGAQVALGMAADQEDCLGAICILPEGVEPGRLSSALRRAGGRKVACFLRSHRALHRLLGPIRRINVRARRALSGALPRALARTSVLFLYDRDGLDEGPTDFSKIKVIIDRLPQAHRARCELRVIADGGLDRFGSIETQAAAIQAIVGWAGERFAIAEADAEVEAVPAARSGPRS
jgi:pimeloyl-ACP methyl ester carboxylesterase